MIELDADEAGMAMSNLHFKDDYIDLANGDGNDEDIDPDEESNMRYGNEEYVKDSDDANECIQSSNSPNDDDEFGFTPPDEAPPPAPRKSASTGMP